MYYHYYLTFIQWKRMNTGDYSRMFTEPKANNYLSIIFGGKYLVQFLNALNTSSWKDFWSKGDSSHYKNSPSFQINYAGLGALSFE